MDSLYSCMYGTSTAYTMSPKDHNISSGQSATECGYFQNGYGCHCQNQRHTDQVQMGRRYSHFPQTPQCMPPVSVSQSDFQFQRFRGSRHVEPVTSINSSEENEVKRDSNTQLQDLNTARCQQKTNVSVNATPPDANQEQVHSDNCTADIERSTFHKSSQHSDIDHGEDVEEESISDDEESEQSYQTFMKHRYDQTRPAQEDTVVKEFLGFVKMASSDINGFFGRKEGHCDIYEDKWATGKSGRDLYYSDLLKIAQGGAEVDDRNRNKIGIIKGKTKCPQDVKMTEGKGKSVVRVGIDLGPLEELFSISNKENDEYKGTATEKCGNLVVSMQKRNLPESFWREPGHSHAKKQKATI